jgi:hypothetical protein
LGAVTGLAGCGGSGVDGGGMSASDRAAAQQALDTLKDTSVATIAIQISGTTGLPTTCRVHLVQRNPWKFELFMGWKPTNQAATGNTYSWLKVLVDRNGPDQRTWHLGTSPHASALTAATGDALSKPYERCEILGAGAIKAVPVG